MHLPGRNQNFKFVHYRKRSLDVFLSALQLVFSHRHPRLQLPRKSLQMGIGSGKRGIKELASCHTGMCDISRKQQGVARF